MPGNGCHRLGQPAHSAFQRVPGSPKLSNIIGIDQIFVPTAQCEALNLDPLPLQRQDLAPDETVAHLRIDVHQIGDALGVLGCGHGRQKISLRTDASALAHWWTCAYPVLKEPNVPVSALHK